MTKVTRHAVAARDLVRLDARDFASEHRPLVEGAVVVVTAGAHEDGAAEVRELQIAVARAVRAAGATHVVVDPPEIVRATRPEAGPDVGGGGGYRDLDPEDAVRRWYAERPPRGLDAEAVVEEVLGALREAEGGGG